jgi:hypothetical protein
VVQSLDRHVPRCSRGRARWSRPTVLAGWTWLAEETQRAGGAAKLQEGQMDCDKGYDYRQLRLALRKRRIIPPHHPL